MILLRLFFQTLLWLCLVPLIRRAFSAARAPSEEFVFWWMTIGILTALFGLMSLVGVLWTVPVFAFGVAVLMPWTIARAIFIPLGMSRCARVLSGLSGWTWGPDRPGGALVGGAWAILRQRDPDRERMADLERRRDRQSAEGQLTGAQVLATGLLAAARGDVESARGLLASVDELGVETTSRTVHALAREWLVVEAAERGAWADVVRYARGQRRTRLTRLLGAIGGRFSDSADAAERPTAARLWLTWMLSPKRRHTLALVRQALATHAPGEQAPVPVERRLETTAVADHYQDALSAHVHALRHDAADLCADDLSRLAGVWDRALAHPDTQILVARRAQTLGARNGDAALRKLADEVSLDVANMARAAGVAIAECDADSRVLADAQMWLRNDLINEVELAFDALQIRIAERRELSSIDEWREYLSLRQLYVRSVGLGGSRLRHLAFPHIHHTVCKLAVWLWNHRDERLMPNAMFHWLLDEALAVGDAEAIELQNRNWDQTL